MRGGAGEGMCVGISGTVMQLQIEFLERVGEEGKGEEVDVGRRRGGFSRRACGFTHITAQCAPGPVPAAQPLTGSCTPRAAWALAPCPGRPPCPLPGDSWTSLIPPFLPLLSPSPCPDLLTPHPHPPHTHTHTRAQSPRNPSPPSTPSPTQTHTRGPPPPPPPSPHPSPHLGRYGRVCGQHHLCPVRVAGRRQVQPRPRLRVPLAQPRVAAHQHQLLACGVVVVVVIVIVVVMVVVMVVVVVVVMVVWMSTVWCVVG